MELLQDQWYGRLLSQRKDSNGTYMAMIGDRSIIYVCISSLVNQNSKYKVLIDVKNESGNGLIYCNIYGGNKSLDFPQIKFICDSKEWKTYEIEVETKSFPKTSALHFRLWRYPGGTGTLLIKSIIFNGDVQENTKKYQALKKEYISENKQILQNVNLMKSDNLNLQNNIKEYTINQSTPFVTFFNNGGAKKVLYLPINNREIKQTGMEDAFIQNDFNLCSFDFLNCVRERNISEAQNIFKKVVCDFRPDWIHMQLQDTNTFSCDFIKEIKLLNPNTIITNWTGDIRNHPISYFVNMSRAVDVSLISSVGQLEMYKNAGCLNVQYWQIGIDIKKFFRYDDDVRNNLYNIFKHDIVFCANPTSNYPGSKIRVETVKSLSNLFENRFAFYGYGWQPNIKCFNGHLNFYEQNKIYNAANMVISINNFNDVELYFSDRQLIAMASGTLTLCHYIPGLERYFTNGKDVAWFKSVDECVQLINYYSNNKSEADEIGICGANKVKNEHSYFERVKELAIRIGMKKDVIIEKQIDISVALGTLNRLDVLKNTIKSIVNSFKYCNFEIIINDAGSIDGTVEWLKNESLKDNRIVPIFSGKKTNITQAYNECFEIARGKFTIWLSDDTMPASDALEKMYILMKDSDEKTMGGFYYRNHPSEQFRIPTTKDVICPVIACVHTKTLKDMQYWNVDYPYYGQDVEFNARLLRIGGKIVPCEGAYIEHLNHIDELKHSNSNAYVQECSAEKFHIIYLKRYGILSAEQYPQFLIISEHESANRIYDFLNKLNVYYKNMNCFIYNKVGIEIDFEKFSFVKVVDENENWNNYDLIFLIGEKENKIFNYDKSINASRFSSFLLNY